MKRRKLDQMSPGMSEVNKELQGEKRLRSIFGQQALVKLETADAAEKKEIFQDARELLKDRYAMVTDSKAKKAHWLKETLGDFMGTFVNSERLYESFDKKGLIPEDDGDFMSSVFVDHSKMISRIEEVDDEELEEMMRLYVSEMQERQKTFEATAKKALEKQEEFFDQAIDNNIIPIDKERVHEILSRLDVYPVDPIMAPHHRSKAAHMNVENIIFYPMMVAEAKDLNKKILSHEVLHALSGKSILQTIDTEDNSHYELQKTGLKFQAEKRSYFDWLNEALTEGVALEMHGKAEDVGDYSIERSLLELLIEKSEGAVDIDDFKKAYFENVQTDDDAGRLSAWKELNKKVNDHYGSKFLTKLDRFINNHGIRLAEESLKDGNIKPIQDWKI